MSKTHPVARSMRALWPALALAACEAPPESERPGRAPPPIVETRIQPIEAICVALVDGSGMVEVETDYLPHVIACENGAADDGALQAQAVAARTYLYYKIRRSGRIGDGQGDQVYTCGRGPDQRHIDAAASTAGQVLMYHDDVIAAFYVAGAIPSTDDCRPAGGDRDPTGTEHYVTYNEGRSGDDLEQTTLGFVAPQNWANRGCKSQNGANCLSQHGVPYDEILRFYYGEDIGLVSADGPCAGDPPPPPPPPPSPPGCEVHVAGAESVIDDADTCFEKTCAPGNSWYDVNAGQAGHSYMTYADDTAEAACSGRWRFHVDAAGDYEVSVYVEDYGPPLSRRATYTVRHAEVEDAVTVDLEGQTGWVPLGTFAFAAAGPAAQWVYLPDNTGEAYVDESGPRLLYDAVRLRPAAPALPPDSGPGGAEGAGGETPRPPSGGGSESDATEPDPDSADVGSTPGSGSPGGGPDAAPGSGPAPSSFVPTSNVPAGAQGSNFDGGCRQTPGGASGALISLFAGLSGLVALRGRRRRRP